MPTSAIILADSISPAGARLTTFQVRGPRFILAQISKHRCMSISCRSSRAVPVKAMIQEVLADPVVPRFGRNAGGMQAVPYADRFVEKDLLQHWNDARDAAVAHARAMARLEASKEVCNRLLEPFGWFDAVISATDYLNFFSLRIHPDAQHEVRELAVLMARAYRGSTPTLREPVDFWEEGGWHLPYVTDQERASLPLPDLRSISAARCGRVSYVPHDSDHPDVARDLARAGRMARERHAVPFEHVASPSVYRHRRSGNFDGWIQRRSGMPGNVAREFDWSLLDREEVAEGRIA